jgi:hypothetical protein
MNSRKKRVDLNIDRKKEILEFKNANPLCSQRDLARKFEISLGAINAMIKNQELITSEESGLKKRDRALAKTESIDKLLFEWLQQKRRRNFNISSECLKEMAMKLSIKFSIVGFKASNGWLNSFQKRHNIKSKAINGEEAEQGQQEAARGEEAAAGRLG